MRKWPAAGPFFALIWTRLSGRIHRIIKFHKLLLIYCCWLLFLLLCNIIAFQSFHVCTYVFLISAIPTCFLLFFSFAILFFPSFSLFLISCSFLLMTFLFFLLLYFVYFCCYTWHNFCLRFWRLVKRLYTVIYKTQKSLTNVLPL